MSNKLKDVISQLLTIESIPHITNYSQLFLRRTPLGPALAVRLKESQIEGAKKGRDHL